MIRRAGVVVSTTLAAGLLSLAIALPAVATPKPKDPPPSGDPRATSYAGNAKTCPDAKLLGEIILKDDSPPETQQYLTINPADIPAGFELTGTVVKGGDGFNVYPPQHLTELHAPLVGQNQNVPAISHWFACGKKKDTTSTPSEPSSPPSNPPGNGSSSANATTTTTPAAQGGGAVSDDELAKTGYSATVPLIAGGALLLIGGGLLLLLRRTRRRG